jgi:hypothetical protein
MVIEFSQILVRTGVGPVAHYSTSAS